MKPSRYLFTGLMLLALGLSGCSQCEEDISSSAITSFAEQSSPSTVAELTQQLRAYNASLGVAEVTTRLSKINIIKIGIDDAFGAINGYKKGGGIKGALIGGAVASIKTCVIKNFSPSVGSSDEWKTSTV